MKDENQEEVGGVGRILRTILGIVALGMSIYCVYKALETFGII